ncbi:MAG: ROK family protein [Chromatiales bacterium]|nr:ROK family protein [Chromatiales bacterium]
MPHEPGVRLGIDLGGTKIEIAALRADGSESFRQRVATPQGDYRATLEAIAALIESADRRLGFAASIGIGTPGAISPTSGLLKNSNSVCLNGQPLFMDLENRLGRPIRMANDADCLTLSEATDGSATGVDIVFGVIIGTGCGGGIVTFGRPLAGANAIAGEWGHNPLPWPTDDERPGRACYCGKRGCVETWLSGPGMTEDHKLRSGTTLSPAQIDLQAQSGDALCESTLQRYEDRMARCLAGVINLLDPQIIVLGGGLSNLTRLYRNVPRLWGRYVFSDRVDTRLVAAKHGDSSGVRGAAMLWPLA